MSKITIQDLKLHKQHKRNLIPLGKKGNSLKIPRDRGWTSITYTRAQLVDALTQGHNLGWRLSPSDLVIDIDPRHGGTESWADLQAYLAKSATRQAKPVSLVDLAPAVQTGNLGLHVYLKLPQKYHVVKENLDSLSSSSYIRLRETLPNYPGLEFKKKGRYVCIARCEHPNGNHYEYHPLSPYTQEAPEAPAALLKLLAYNPKTAQRWDPNDPPDLSNTDLQYILSHLDPIEQFRNQGAKYQDFMFAVHFATRGNSIARDVFVDWSIKDPQYLHHSHIIGQRWDSLLFEKDSLITTGTLKRFCSKQNIPWPPALREAQAAFKDHTASALDAEYVATAKPLPDDPTTSPSAPSRPSSTDCDAAIAEIELLRPNAQGLAEKVYKHIRLGCEVGIIELMRIKEALRWSLKYRQRDLDKIESAVRKELRAEALQQAEIPTSADELVADRVLADHFAGGEMLIHAQNQQFYAYGTTHWEPLLPNRLAQIIYNTSNTMKREKLSLDFSNVSVLPRTALILQARQAQATDLLGIARNPKPVYNTLTCELHYDRATKVFKPQPHSPNSHLINCLKTTYDANATCPLFDQFLADVFAPLSDPQAAIQTVLELLGYMLQPHKPYPLIVLCKGSGGNGKTSLFDILTALLSADNILPRSVLEFANTAKNNHALAALPGKLILLDDDMGTEIRLPASALKKISENKVMEANPKGMPMYNFVNTATPVILTNSNPQIPDLSKGLQRRLVVIPFNRYFPHAERDYTLIPRIIKHELPGVFNRLLRGAERLFSRHHFALCADLQAAVDQVTAAGNQLRRFLFEATRPNQSAATTLADLYSHYKEWAIHSYGTRRPYTLADFEAQLSNADYLIAAQPDGTRVVEGVVPWSPDSVPDNVVTLQGGAS